MADRPIIFSAPMVRALLDGRKTQTRRVLNPQPHEWQAQVIDIGRPHFDDDEGAWGQWETEWDTPSYDMPMGQPAREIWRPLRIPYATGDRLYVREAFSYETLDVDRNGFMPPWYWADGNPSGGDWARPKPSIHMPRWASRITLTVTAVRVQRLQEISEADAVAEGIKLHSLAGLSGWADYATVDAFVKRYFADPRKSYASLWNSLHGPDAWDANPWVGAATFTVRHGNIDHVAAA